MKHNNFVFICIFCNKKFIAKQSRERKFCSIEHFRIWSKGKINKKPISEEKKKKISDFQKNRKKGSNNPEHNKKISESRKGMKFTAEHRQNMSKKRIEKLINNEIKHFSSKQEKYLSIKTNEINHSHSSYESKYMKYLDSEQEVKYWTKNHGIVIDYSINNTNYKYLPDFYLEYQSGKKEIVEIKGRIYDNEKFLAKCEAANKYCKINNLNYRVVRKNDLEKLNGCI